jgi:PAS domain S-box-containing protein
MENRIFNSNGAEKFPEGDDGNRRKETDRMASSLKIFGYSTSRGSVLYFFLIIACSIFFGAVLVMLVLGALSPLSIMITAILDATLLLITIFPILYFFIFLSFKSQITKQKQAEDELNILVNRMPDGVYKSTDDGKFIEINPAMVKILGYDSKEELMAIDIKAQLYFESGDRESLILQEQNEEMGVYRLKKKDGSAVWVEDHGWYNLGKNGEIITHEGDYARYYRP